MSVGFHGLLHSNYSASLPPQGRLAPGHLLGVLPYHPDHPRPGHEEVHRFLILFGSWSNSFISWIANSISDMLNLDINIRMKEQVTQHTKVVTFIITHLVSPRNVSIQINQPHWIPVMIFCPP